MTRYVLFANGKTAAYIESEMSGADLARDWSIRANVISMSDSLLFARLSGMWFTKREDGSFYSEQLDAASNLLLKDFETKYLQNTDQLPEIEEYVKTVLNDIKALRKAKERQEDTVSERRQMTMAEVEKALGYKISIIS